MARESRTLGALVSEAQARLKDAGHENFLNEARWIVSETVKRSVSDLLLQADCEIEPQLCKEVLKRVGRRQEGEPLAYVLGTVEFRGFSFFVDKRVLIPRPETEGLVSLVAEGVDLDEPVYCLEIGVGSGCIAVSILKECPNAVVVGTDISSDALSVCVANAEAHHVSDRLTLVHCPEMSQVQNQRFSWVISNPPYIAHDDTRVEENVRMWEPPSALFADRSGLQIIAKIVDGAGSVLEPNGRLLLEHGDTQGPEVEQLCIAAGMQTRAHLDCFGRPRFVEAWFELDTP